MARQSVKAENRLEARLRDYDSNMVKEESNPKLHFHRPGSCKRKV